MGKAVRFPADEIDRFEREGGVARPRQAAPPAPFKRFTINRRHACSGFTLPSWPQCLSAIFLHDEQKRHPARPQ